MTKSESKEGFIVRNLSFGIDMFKTALSKGRSSWGGDKSSAEGTPEEGTPAHTVHSRDHGVIEEAGSEFDTDTMDGSSGFVPVDPQSKKPILMAPLNQSIAVLNVALGLLYLCWRVFRGFNPNTDFRDWAPIGSYYYDVDDPNKPWQIRDELKLNWFGWVLLFGEAMLMVAVWLSHCSRMFPAKRVNVTMNELIDVDLELSRRTQVCILLPSQGEELQILREAILGCMSLHLWPGKLDIRRNIRLVVIDDQRRPEVRLLLALCYRLASMFCNNRKVRMQLKMEGRPKITLQEFFAYFLQCTAGFGKTYSDNFTDVFAIADMISKLCKDNSVPEDWDGLELPTGKRVDPRGLQTDLTRLPRLRENFDDVRNIISLVYYARSDPEEPASCVMGGMLNSVLFAEDPADADILGDAQFVVVAHNKHVLQTEFLQRTLPYFYKIKRTKGRSELSYEICNEVAYVQVPLRFSMDKNKDPLGNQDLILHDVKNVGRDGWGGAFAQKHGCVFRVDVLVDGKNATGEEVVALEKRNEHVGKELGFSTFTKCTMTMTCIELFQRGYRSVYVHEMGETLSMCTEQNRRLDGRVQDLFDEYRSAAEISISDPWGLIKSKYTTAYHRLVVLEQLWFPFFMGVGVEVVVASVIIYCCIWRRPFFSHGIEFLLFFLPYYVSAGLPTALILNWKRTRPDPAFRSVQLLTALAYVPVIAYVGVGLSELSRALCSRQNQRQFTVDGAPLWPLYSTITCLFAGGVVSFIYWAQRRFRHSGLWITSMIMLACVFAMVLPSAMRGIRYKGPALFYMRYFVLAVLVVVVAFWQQAAPNIPGSKIGGK